MIYVLLASVVVLAIGTLAAMVFSANRWYEATVQAIHSQAAATADVQEVLTRLVAPDSQYAPEPATPTSFMSSDPETLAGMVDDTDWTDSREGIGPEEMPYQRADEAFEALYPWEANL